VTLERDGAVVTVTIDREEALGALSRGILEALLQLEEMLSTDDSAGVVILTGTGKGFIAGADIGEYDGVSQEAFDEYQRLGRRVFDGWAALPQYTIAAVNGWALGGGFEIALCCDEIIASEWARFGLPEVKLGLLPGGGGSQRLSRALGARFTKRLMVTGEFVRAAELHRLGLITDLAPDTPALLEKVRDHAAGIAQNAPIAVRRAKRVVMEGLELPLEEALAMEQQVLSSLHATADAREGIAAFIGKRQPEFQGR
jgi:enoyl-CoA hydratase